MVVGRTIGDSFSVMVMSLIYEIKQYDGTVIVIGSGDVGLIGLAYNPVK